MKRLCLLVCGCANLLGIEDPKPGPGPKPDGGDMIDAGSDGPMQFMCNDDSQLEPNDTLATAVATPVEQTMETFTLANLAICPDVDKDLYEVQILQNIQNLQFTVTTTGGAPAHVQMLNSGGIVIANGNPGGPNQQIVNAANLPAGQFYAQVDGTAQSNYNLDIHVVK